MESVVGRTVPISISVLSAEDLMLSQLALKESHQGGRGNLGVGETLLVKGPIPIRLSVLEHWLRSFPKVSDGEYLRKGFSVGF